MCSRRKNHPLISNLEITDIAAEGKSIGRYNDMVVFVPLTVPGDVVDVQVVRKRKRFMEGYVTDFIKYSDKRIEAPCQHFGVCGGCKWQNLSYPDQLEFKRTQVREQLSRIGKADIPDVPPVEGSEDIFFYRNKLEYTFSSRRWLTKEEIDCQGDITDPEGLGFHIPGKFDKILDIEKCWLQPDPSNEIRLSVKNFCFENGYDFYDAHTHKGLMRNLVIRTSSTGEIMVIVIFGYEDREKIEALMSFLQERFPGITSLQYIVNTKLNDSYTDQEIILFSGRDHIFEEMEDLRFKIGGKSFYQTNSRQAYKLYDITRRIAGLKPDDIVYDLYTGTGTIANFVARRCAKVVGVEYVPEAIEDAKINSEINGINNTLFFAGDMKDVLTGSFIETHGRPDVVILDPPRAGIHEDVALTIIRSAPDRIVYVSCNPATQARDIAIFDELYSVEAIQPVDMFPHTHHIENIVLLRRRQ